MYGHSCSVASSVNGAWSGHPCNFKQMGLAFEMEALGCSTGLRRICRSTKNLGNVCLSLAFEKGRSSSGTLNGVLRRAAAYVMGGRLQWRLRRRWFQPKGQKNRRPIEVPRDGHVLMTDFESGGGSSSSTSRPFGNGAAQDDKKGFFLEIFWGTARPTSQMRSAGIACFPDIEIGEQYNLLRKSTQRRLLQMILEGKIVYLHCGAPCTAGETQHQELC